jgi:NADH dehydrogenase [ubiquinone] 1 alpha subcomplex assembly factor 7
VTPLAEKLARHIRVAGPISVADFMAVCLADPEHGYYMQREAFGRDGDFITAPEVSQIFGELLGIWAVAAWEMMGNPRSFILAELGPGRGTLLADLLRTAKIKPAFLKAADIHLLEISPRLIEVQKQTLLPTGVPIHWHGRLDDIPPGPAIVIANEFFDALPVHQFVWAEGHWAERVVGLAADGALAFGLRPVEQPPPPAPLPEGTVVEASPAARAGMTTLAERLKRDGGAALIVDYGSAKPGGKSTLQAVRAHNHDDPLAAPGEADLTAHVDFAALARIATEAGAEPRALMRQGEFLIRMGLVERAKVLGRGKDTKTRDAIAAGMERLASPKAMGDLFKVLAVSGPGLHLPVFDPYPAEAKPAAGT